MPGNVKAYLRGSKCLAKMGDWGAAEDFASAGMKKVSQSESSAGRRGNCELLQSLYVAANTFVPSVTLKDAR